MALLSVRDFENLRKALNCTLVLAHVVSTSLFIRAMSAFFDFLRRHAALLASLAGNMVLAGCVLVMWKKGAAHVKQPAFSAEVVEKAGKENEAPVQEPVTPPFHWRHLDAPDFPTFVKNLRAVGCPEATIRDIIQGELAEIYAARRQEAERELATAPEIAHEVLKERLQKMTVEETSLLASLTNDGAMSGPATTGDQTGPPAAAVKNAEMAAGQQEQGGTVLTPAAFLVGNDPGQPGTMNEISLRPTDPALDAATAQVIGGIRDGFASSLAGAGNDPSSVFYRQRWLAAQRQSDEIYSSLFGGDGFVRAQAEAAQKQAQGLAR